MSDLIIGDDEFDLEQLLNDPDFLNDVDFLSDSPGQGSDPGQDPKQKFAEIDVFLNDSPGQDSDPGRESDPDPKQKFAEIEELLMNDDEFEDDESKKLLYNVLLDSPVESEASRGEVVNVNGSDSNLNSNSSNSKASSVEEVGDCDGNGFDSKVNSPEEVENCDKEEDTKKRNKESDDGEDDDPVMKKRKRQERNRDAAVRSRERKKLYVKDLEMKSRYFEGECKRLGMLLNCVVAENQALRLSLHSTKAFGASMTKQESAVLLLESLLLGSLLWFLGTMCLLILPDPLRLTKEEVPLENVDNQNRGSLALRKAGKIVEHGAHRSFMLGKSCKASRSRMRTSYFVLEVLT